MTTNTPFELKIAGLADASDLANTWASHVISLLDPDYNGQLPGNPAEMAVCRLYFNDTTPADSEDFKLFYKTTPVVANKPQMQHLLTFSEALQADHHVLVHCHAGISRSTAVACGVLCQHGMSVEAALEAVIAVREIAYPNMHVIELLDELLGLHGTLRDAVKERFG